MVGTAENKSGRTTYVVLMLLWLLLLPFYALGMAFTGFAALSPMGLIADMTLLPATMQPVTLRLLSWLYLLWPLMAYYWLVRRPSKA